MPTHRGSRRRGSSRRGGGKRPAVPRDPWNPSLANTLKFLLSSNKITSGGARNLLFIISEAMVSPDQAALWPQIYRIKNNIDLTNLEILLIILSNRMTLL